MKELSINTLCGLHNMLYDRSNLDYCIEVPDEKNFLDINKLFWSQILNPEVIKNTVYKYIDISSTFSQLTIQEQYVINAPEIFIKRVNEAKSKIIICNTSNEELFSYIETLNIYCKLYSKLLPMNFTLTIEQGFHRNSNSAKEMLEHCLLKYSNPYLEFITQTVLAIIMKYNPDIIWMQGIPNIGSFAIAKLVKMKLPNVHISIANHSTEYYSLNKLKENLLNNTYLFECFDSIILNDNTSETKKNIVNALKHNLSLNCISNIIYKTPKGRIDTTGINATYPKYSFDIDNISTNSIVNIKLFPKNHCYWNACTFCGINNKYLDNSSNWNINDALEQIEYLANNNINMFWSIDEAIPPQILQQLAKKMNDKNYNFIWHTRSRLDMGWLDERIIQELATSGLTQIRMGFESASIRILKLMNKYENYELIMKNVENILKLFSKYNIRVHFPAIIGFPTETIYEREETINYLEYLYKKYSLFSYNINILELDISSKLYKNWDKYNITSIGLPCSLPTFMGNIVEWYEPIVHSNLQSLEASRRTAMLYQYSWYPLDAITEPHIFYRLSESGRYMLCSNQIHNQNNELLQEQPEFIIKAYPELVSWKTQMGTYITYNPNNHHYYECSQIFYTLINHEGILVDDIRYYSKITKLINEKFVFIERR